jgi:hypothetical protein
MDDYTYDGTRPESITSNPHDVNRRATLTQETQRDFE